MLRLATCAALIVLVLATSAFAQLTPKRGVSLAPTSAPAAAAPAADSNVQWRTPKKGLPGVKPTALHERRETTAARTDVKPRVDTVAPSATRVTVGDGKLPTNRGQVWREYDIRPYTSKVTTTEKPEQAIVDWVLRETGTDVWFTDAVCVLNADRDTLRVYHTPEVQRLVADIVDRFVLSQAEAYSLGLKLVTIGSPNWRAKFHTMLRPVTVQSPGVEAWLLSKEHATYLSAELSKRTDYRELNAPSVGVQNGQSQTVAQTKLRSYVRGVRMKEAYPFYDTENGQIDEGYSLQVSPLFTADSSAMDLVLKCHIDQLEKLVPVTLEIPQGQAAPARVNIQVPQVVSWRLHERFRWPADQVLLLSCGVVATPTGEKMSPLGIPGLGLGAARADALLFIESHGKLGALPATTTPAAPAPAATAVVPTISRGRY
jgi:hypothetical protein